jgi:hypothetical protein
MVSKRKAAANALAHTADEIEGGVRFETDAIAVILSNVEDTRAAFNVGGNPRLRPLGNHELLRVVEISRNFLAEAGYGRADFKQGIRQLIRFSALKPPDRARRNAKMNSKSCCAAVRRRGRRRTSCFALRRTRHCKRDRRQNAASSLRLRVLDKFAYPKTDYRKRKCKSRKYYNRDFELAGRVGILRDVGNSIHRSINWRRISHG